MQCMLIVALLIGWRPAGAAPRYSLRAGERIEYRRTVVLETENGAAFEELIQLYVLEASATEAHVLALRVRDGSPSSGLHFRLSDRGHIALPDESHNRADAAVDLYELFPTLGPALDNPDVWVGDADPFGRVLRQRRTATEGNSVQVRFTVEDPTGVADFLGDSTEGVYWLDSEGGLMTRREASHYSGREKGKRQIRCELIGREAMEPAWMAARRAELDRFVRSQRIEDGLLEELCTQPARAGGTIRRLEHLWGEYRAQPPRDDRSPLRQLAEVLERRAAALTPALRERAGLVASWVGTPAAQWSFQDTAGETVTSEAARKGVTVECFWSSSSIASLRMFAVLERLRSEVVPPPSIVCINVDTDLASARRAASACNRDLLTVFSGPPMEGELPLSLPVVRILDESGRVRGVQFGWRWSLADSVRALGAGKPKRRSP